MLTESITYSAALMAGILSFFSPCVLPLLPAYFSFISGYSTEELTKSIAAEIRTKVFFSTIAFVSGFSLYLSFLALPQHILAASLGDTAISFELLVVLLL